MQNMDWLEKIGKMIPSFLYVPVFVAAWILALWLVKRLIVGRLKQWAAKTAQHWDDIIIGAISIPNAKLTGSVITNFHLPNKEMIVTVDVGVDYSSDLERVEKVTLDTAGELIKKTRGAVPDFEPLVRFHTFGESGINFTVVLKAKEAQDRYVLKHELIKSLHTRYQKEGIQNPVSDT